jgi:acyl carrier protein
MPQKLDVGVVLEALTDAVSYVCDVDPASLDPNAVFGDLGIDSMDAADIVIRAQADLGVEIDFRQLPADWSDLTLPELAAKVAQLMAERPPPTVAVISSRPEPGPEAGV